MFPIIPNTYLIQMMYPIHNSPVGISIALTIHSLDPLGLWRERNSALLYTYRPAGAFKTWWAMPPYNTGICNHKKEAMNMALTDEQKQHFDENGYIIVRNLLSDEEVQAVGTRADQIAVGEVVPEPGFGRQVEPAIQRKEAEAKSTLESIRKLGGLVRTDPVMHAHATNPKILDVLEDLIGPDIKLFGDQLFMKSSAHGSRKNYHQDSNSWRPYVPYSLVSCWAALDDATVENGCLWFIPGSHKWGLLRR